MTPPPETSRRGAPRCALLAATVAAVFALLPAAPSCADEWDTYYEKSGYLRTPPYDETVAYCRRLADASPLVHFATFGASPRGRDLPLLIVDHDGRFDAASVRETDRVVFLIQAGIHSGEIDGKDAGLMLIRDMVIRNRYPGLLDHVTILFIPIYNVDGHERSGPYNRMNQNGPAEMGWRTNAANLNLNRDYLKADAPETWAWLRLYTEWLPEFFADCHVTDGADYQYVVTEAVEVYGNMDDGLTSWARDRYLAPLYDRMNEDGLHMSRYNWYRDERTPRSGIRSWAAPPMFATGYTVVQNRPGILIETHSLKDYRTRVTGTYQALLRTLEILNEEHETLRGLCRAADRRAASPEFRATPFSLAFDTSSDSTFREFLGYEYDIVESDVTGGEWIRFSNEPMKIQIPWFGEQVVTKAATLPEAYIIPPEWWEVVARIELHGVAFARIAEEVTLDVETYRFHDVAWAEKPFEGRHRVTFAFDAEEEERTYPAGSIVVDMNQRAARVAAHILEPDSPDSFVSWGFFDAIFEQKEYAEGYVLEPMAREMLAGDPALRAAFEKKKAEDEAFAADPKAIRRWFYRRTPYWDEQKDLYPVGRIMRRADVERILR